MRSGRAREGGGGDTGTGGGARASGGGRRLGAGLPPRPVGLKGRRVELGTLEAVLASGRVDRIALVGGGGSGKSLLAAALVHRLRRRRGGIAAGGAFWIRVGGWDHRTLLQMMALRLGAPREPLVESVRRALEARGPTLWVLDNHENDRAMARFLEALAGTPTTFILTARRCLLSGVAIFPVVPPLIQARQTPFPRVKALTRLLRWNPLALDMCDALVMAGVTTPEALRDWLLARDVTRVRPMLHEDDIVEVRLVVDWAWERLSAEARRMLVVLAHSPGDHMSASSLLALARAGGQSRRAAGRRALAQLGRWRLVQEHLPGRFALHAVVRCAVAARGSVAAERYFAHYVALVERQPGLLAIEQSNVFAAMDHAQSAASLNKVLRALALLD
jgi:hypothetical protein